MPHLKTKATSILVVEDNPFDKLVVKVLLQNHFNIHTAVNGHEALTALEEQKIDIVLMDINLGDENMNGTAVMKLIKNNKKHQHIKVFVVTAYAENESFYLDQGFDALYIKPVIKEEIFEFINKNMLKKSKLFPDY